MVKYSLSSSNSFYKIYLVFFKLFIKIHSLNFKKHDISIFEVRHPEGYGARWAIILPSNEIQFRGFLEVISLILLLKTNLLFLYF